MADALTTLPLRDIEPQLDGLRQYWASLLRGSNSATPYRAGDHSRATVWR